MNYILIAKTTDGWFILFTKTLAHNHLPGDYWFDHVTQEEIGQLLGGN